MIFTPMQVTAHTGLQQNLVRWNQHRKAASSCILCTREHLQIATYSSSLWMLPFILCKRLTLFSLLFMRLMPSFIEAMAASMSSSTHSNKACCSALHSFSIAHGFLDDDLCFRLRSTGPTGAAGCSAPKAAAKVLVLAMDLTLSLSLFNSFNSFRCWRCEASTFDSLLR